MSNRLRNNLFAGLIVLTFLTSCLTLVGCSVFPNVTTLSATTKATTDAVPTVKVQQTFKWSKNK